MRKLDLKDKVERQWFSVTKETNGWEVWQNMVNNKSQEEIARVFHISLNTSHRWHKEYQEMKV